ncbi:MAG: hypothetical protein ACR2QH_09870 [Geminicoccaceae bacterium]
MNEIHSPNIVPPFRIGSAFAHVDVTVRNCTLHDLRNVRLIARGTDFATVTSDDSLELGDVLAFGSATRTFSCSADEQTPVGAPADTLINLSVRANLDFIGTDTQAVLGEIAAPD